MSTLEKLLLLKTVSLFKEIPDDLLLHMITTLVEEKRIPENTEILKKGALNSLMYILASGTIEIHDKNGRTIEKLGPRNFFGELSALTGQPTISYVSTLTDCLLLTINGDALYDLMSIEPELSKDIIQALCERTQNMSLQIERLIQDPIS